MTVSAMLDAYTPGVRPPTTRVPDPVSCWYDNRCSDSTLNGLRRPCLRMAALHELTRKAGWASPIQILWWIGCDGSPMEYAGMVALRPVQEALMVRRLRRTCVAMRAKPDIANRCPSFRGMSDSDSEGALSNVN